MKELFIFHPSTAMVWGMIVGIVMLLPLLFLIFAYFSLAPKDKWFTFGKQNRIKYIMTANGGKWTGRMIFPSKTYYIDPISYDINKITADTPKEYYQKWNFFGMYWVGIPPFKKIHMYHMTWLEWEKKKDDSKKDDDGKYGLRLRDEQTPYLFVKRVAYGMSILSAETLEQYTVDLYFVVYIEAENAYKPIFGSDDAYGQVETLVRGTAASYVKVTPFVSLNAEKKTLDDQTSVQSDFSRTISNLTNTIDGEEGKGVREKFGYRIYAAKIISVSISGEASKKITDATIEAAVAEQEKLAAIARGEGEAGAMDAITAAKTKRAKVYEDSPGMLQVDLAEATFGEHSKLTTYVNGKTDAVLPLK